LILTSWFVRREGGGSINADADRTLQSLLNLIGNAVKYNKPGGSVNVRVERDEQRTLFSVSDTGLGIPAEKHSQVFETFNRLGFWFELPNEPRSTASPEQEAA